ncbi:MAG: nitrilase-related carbon-nitrogen hydrolase, partial [Oceanobacter sp.]
MTESLRIALAQCNFVVGDLAANTDTMLAAVDQAKARGAHLILFSELSVTGYPPEDLLLRPSLQTRVEAQIERLIQASDGIAIVAGFPWCENDQLFNCAETWFNGKSLGRYAKQCLPNFQVFDEHRYFTAGDESLVFELLGHKLGLTICEDVWHQHPVDQCVEAGAELLLNLNASPFHMGKHQLRYDVLHDHVTRRGVPIVYVNQVGGQDELVFDGGSFAMNATGESVLQLPCYVESSGDLTWDGSQLTAIDAPAESEFNELESLYQALVLG